MQTEQMKERIFYIIKYWCDHELGNQKCYLDVDEFYRRCNHRELSDARVLYKMIEKEVAAHNSKIDTRRTLLKNLRYTPKYLTSKVFSGLTIPIKLIEKIVADNPDKGTYECFRLTLK